jgi:carboxynorspermidine decarboxylase
MGYYHFKKPLKPGDKIIFDDMIHYTMVKTNTFNGVQLPSIGTVDKDRNFSLIKSFGYQDYKNRLS